MSKSSDKFNVNKIIEESILEVQESDKVEETDAGVLEESANVGSVVQNFLGDFDIQANFEALEGLAKSIHGLPRVKEAAKMFEGEDVQLLQAKTLNEESDGITESVTRFIKGEGSDTKYVIPEAAGFSSGLGALSFAKKLRRFQ